MIKNTRRDQPSVLRWLRAYQDVAAVHGNGVGQYQSRKAKRYKDPVGDEFELRVEHCSVWQTLVALALDVSTDRALVQHSGNGIAYFSGLNNSSKSLLLVLRDLEIVGLIRREQRARKQTTLTHLFLTPIQPGEDWTKRKSSSLAVLIDEDEPIKVDPSVAPPPSDPLEGFGPAIMQYIEVAFHESKCLAEQEDRDKLAWRFPQWSKVAGSPRRLALLFSHLAEDETKRGRNIRENMRTAKAPGAYITKCLKPWLSDYANEIDHYDDDAEDPKEGQDEPQEAQSEPEEEPYGEFDNWFPPKELIKAAPAAPRPVSPPPTVPAPALPPAPKPTPPAPKAAPPPPPEPEPEPELEPEPEPEPTPEEIAAQTATIALLRESFGTLVDKPFEEFNLRDRVPKMHARAGSAEDFDEIIRWIANDACEYCVEARKSLGEQRSISYALCLYLPGWMYQFGKHTKLTKA